MTDITFDQIMELVDQLTPHEQTQLTTHLLERARQRGLSVDEKMTLLRAAQFDVAVNQEPSPHRQDWYSDDGR